MGKIEIVPLIFLGLAALCFGTVLSGTDTVNVIPTSAESLEGNLNRLFGDQFAIPRNDSWLCFDYSVEYRARNPEWGMLIIAKPDNPEFKSISTKHCVNYMFNDEGHLMIHDESEFVHYIREDWINSTQYFYFVPNPDTFENRWISLSDNRYEI